MSQDTQTPQDNNLGWDPTDPHGMHADDASHEHFVADWKMQITVLAVLLFLTVLTVGFYNLEGWAESAFEITLPHWVNIAGAMSIALVKGLLVAAFFMQLRYDKALNTFVMLFCLFCVALFLTFSMIDLDSRDWVDSYKKPSILEGGTGVGLNNAPANKEFSIKIAPKVNTGGDNIVDYARLHGNDVEHGLLYYREHNDEATFWAHFYQGHATHRDHLDEHNFFEQLGFAHHDEQSDANKSRPKHGLTPGLFDDVDPKALHASEHEAHGH